MRQELFYKIILLRKSPYFECLSPYSLVMLASNIDVREYKYGEVILNQGEIPSACYIMAYGRAKAVYQFAASRTIAMSKYAKKTLKKTKTEPFQTGSVDYKNLAFKNSHLPRRKRLDYHKMVEKVTSELNEK